MTITPRALLYRLHWEARSRAEGFGLMQALRLLRESERWARPRLDALRDEKLRRVVTHAYAESPGYRKLMDAHGVRPEHIHGVADLSRLPILTKDLLRERNEELRCRDQTAVEYGVTGGTTGNPLKIARDRKGSVWQRAEYWRGFGWAGLELGDRFAQVFGGTLGVVAPRPMNRLKSWFAGKVFLPAFELGPHNAEAYLEVIRRSGAQYLIGYTSAIYLLAHYLERKGAGIHLRAVFPTAELLPVDWAEVIARVFGAKVLPYYGCGEVHSLGYACPEADGAIGQTTYHTCDEHAIIEVETAGGATATAGEGAFLISDLDNLATPILRYRNGDAGEIAGPGCRCGRSLGRIVRLDGRVNDVLYTERGDAISGAIGPHAFRNVVGVEQYQLVQRRIGELVLRIVALPAYAAAVEEPKLLRIFSGHLGAATAITFDYVKDIPRTAAGKARFVISEVGSPAAPAPVSGSTTP